MSDTDVIVISSDEDSNSIKVSEEDGRTINVKTVQTSNAKVQNNEQDDICYVDITNTSVNTTTKEIKKEELIIQSDQSSLAAIKTEITSNNIEVVENNICGNESDTFKKFMSTVLSLEEGEEIKTKLVKKLSKYYKLADPNYIQSLEFNQVLERGIEKIKNNSVYLYFVLKEVKDFLTNRVDLEALKNPKEKILGSDENVIDVNEDQKKYQIVKKLSSFLKKLEKKIKELEEMEVDFSDEEDSSYFKMQRYRERYCQVYKKLCTYTNQPLDANRIGASRKINFTDTDNLELNRAIEKWLNKTKQFPDYTDINKLITELNQSLNLKLNKEQTNIKARQIFEKIGNMLQRRRHFELWDSLSSFLDTDIDPAIKNPDLDSLLQKNFELGMKKEKELLKYYAEKQEAEKLQPREVLDEEANCSPTESGDEDEKEIENIECMLDSKISSSDDEDEGKSDEESKSVDSSVFPSTSKTVEKDSSMIDLNPETEADGNDHQNESVSSDWFMQTNQVDGNNEASHEPVNSKEIETVVETKNGIISVKDEHVVGVTPRKQCAKDNHDSCRSKRLIKRKNENDNDNDIDIDIENGNENISTHSCKRFSKGNGTRHEVKSFKKTKLINQSDSDSDCEIIEIISDKKAKTNDAPGLERKVYQINYAFINNNFNYNTILSNNIFRKRNCFCSNYKTMKNQQSANNYVLPLTDLTNIKSITSKFAWYRENKMKKKLRNVLNKPKFLSQSLKGSSLKQNDLTISLAKNSISCALQQETNAENMKSQKEGDKVNDNNDFQQGSGEETARSPTNGSSGGGNGQDNSENNGNKKPFDQENETEDNQENEEKEENEEEGADGSEDKKLPETSEVVDTVPKSETNQCSETGTYPSEQNCSDATHSNLPMIRKAAPIDRKGSGKHSEKTYGNEVIKGTGAEFLKFLQNTSPSKTKKPSTRKRKVNENGGTKNTYRQGNVNTSAVKFKKLATEPMKQEVNKVVPTTTLTAPSSDNDVEIIQVTKKKRSTPVKAVQSDEEIVKNFLQRSHPSISITTPKKRAVQKEPSASVLQALETLSRLKGISTTIVKGSAKHKTDEDVTVIGESLSAKVSQISKQCRTPQPNTTATSSVDCMIPKIVTVQGNVSGFENITNDSTTVEENFYACVQSPQAHLANVSGNPSNYEESFTGTTEGIPIPRFRNVKSRSRRTPKNKTKNVEYVILD